MPFFMFQTLAILQLAFFAMAQNSPGSLNECGEVNNANDSAGENWDYKFHCPSGYECVNKECRNEAGTVVKSVVDRCSTNTNQCEENIDLTAKCGLAFTRSDNQTYYFNCGGAGAECIYRISQCSVWTTYMPAIITSCNHANLLVTDGQCQGNCPADLMCKQIVP